MSPLLLLVGLGLGGYLAVWRNKRALKVKASASVSCTLPAQSRYAASPTPGSSTALAKRNHRLHRGDFAAFEVQINRSTEVITLEDKHLVYHLQLKLSSTLLSDHLNEWGKG